MPFISQKPKLVIHEKELTFLTSISKSRTLPFHRIERAKMLLAYNNGETISGIARMLHTNRPKVERTINKALGYGIEAALNDKPRKGRPPTITSEARVWIISLACSKPKEHGYASELWTNRSLRDHLRNHCIEKGHPDLSQISGGTISKILNKSNIKPHKISSYLQRRDPEFEEKSAKVLYTYKQVEIFQEKIQNGEPILVAFISYDEKPNIQAIENIAPDLPPVPGKYSSFSRDYEYKRHGTLSLLAGIDLLTGDIHALVFDHHKSREFIEFLKHLDSVYPQDVNIVVILDNLKVHTSKETMNYLLTIPNRFSFVFTPKHASWLNIIECFFSKMARSFLRGIRVSSKNELKNRILMYIDEVNEMPVIFKWTYKMDSIPGGLEI